MRRALSLLLTIAMGWTAAASHAQQATPAGGLDPAAQHGPLEVSFSYDDARGNAEPGHCGCFSMNGGSAEVAFHAWRGLSAVADLSGERASRIRAAAGLGMSLVAFTVGPRYSLHFSGGKVLRYSPFVQGLVGSAHGFDSIFPAATGSLAGAASSLAVLAGGGLDITLNRYAAVRAIEADYLRIRLPNDAGNEQNLLRLGAGIVLRAW